MLNPHQIHWTSKLAIFKYKMVYIKRSSNAAADALSHCPDHGVSEIEEMPPVFPDIVEVNSVICFAIGDKECMDALKECHDSPWAGHPGPEKTFDLLSRKYWWQWRKMFINMSMGVSLAREISLITLDEMLF